ncbi:MAG: GNAT family N-acetyltransferase [Desulfovibrio sp.]|nr:GNAT family N-acetyltransferase [Desulfovibrio sp.]
MIIRKLKADDVTDAFSCGRPSLDRYLRRYAWVNQKANSAQTYVAVSDVGIVGYYSLSVAAVDWANAPERVGKGLARHPVPVMLLARLAVNLEQQRCGIGKALLKDALLRTLQAADIAGVRAMLVHAKDDAARQWYLRWEFEASPTNPLHLFLLLKDMRHAAR